MLAAAYLKIIKNFEEVIAKNELAKLHKSLKKNPASPEFKEVDKQLKNSFGKPPYKDYEDLELYNILSRFKEVVSVLAKRDFKPSNKKMTHLLFVKRWETA